MKEFFLEPADFGDGFLSLVSIVIIAGVFSKFVSFVVSLRESEVVCDRRKLLEVTGEKVKLILSALAVYIIIILFVIVGSFAMSIITNIIINTFNL